MTQQWKNCPICGCDNDPNDSICRSCGNSLQSLGSTPIPSSAQLPLLVPHQQALQPNPPSSGIQRSTYGAFLVLLSSITSLSSLNNVSIWGPLPRLLLIRVLFSPPDLEGIIKYDPLTRSPVPYRPSLTERIWNGPIHQAVSVNVLQVRVEVPGQQYPREARLEGNLLGSQLYKSDKVSFWGYQRAGVLIVKIGFNHTTRAKILVKPPQRPWRRRWRRHIFIVLLILVFMLMFFFILFNLAVSLLTAL